MPNATFNDILLDEQVETENGRQPRASQQRPGRRDARRSTGRASLPAIATTLIESIPGSATGQDRVQFLAEQVEALMEEDRTKLRTYFEQFIREMLEMDASDIDAGGPACKGYVWYRVDGDKRPREDLGEHSMDQTDVLFLSFLDPEQVETLFEEGAVDFSHQLPREDTGALRQRFRVTCYFDYDRLAINMRAIADELRPLGSLGFHKAIEQGLMFRHVRDGLTLITGVTGSGKSTTLDAIVDANNEDVPAHIVIVARPIEYMHHSKQCIVRHREVGKDVRSFKRGIVQALRQDPDIVVVGEMRDPETISAALEVTDSGHKVFSTLHTSSAQETISRVVAEYPPHEQTRVRHRLADVLRCVVSQKLLPKNGGGRALAKEVLWLTPSAKAAIKNDNVNELYQMMWEGGRLGQTTLEQDLFRLLRRREITPEVALDFANNKKRLKSLMR